MAAGQVRAFLARVVRYLAGEKGIRQFLDIGTGLPSASNTHEVAQAVAPSGSTPGVTVSFASRAEVERFFAGLELAEPGIATANRWRPEPGTPQQELPAYVAVARKP